MFNATRVAALVAILTLGGSLALITGPLAPDREIGVVPDAEATFDPTQLGSFTGTWISGVCAACPDQRLRGDIEVNDARIGGVMYLLVGTNSFESGEPWGAISSAILVENEGGTWRGQSTGYLRPGSGGTRFQALLSGEGGYQGLSALLSLSQDQMGFLYEVEGVIWPGDAPEFPTLEPLGQ